MAEGIVSKIFNDKFVKRIRIITKKNLMIVKVIMSFVVPIPILFFWENNLHSIVISDDYM